MKTWFCVLLLSVLFFRIRHPAKQIIFKPNLPAAHFAYGDATSSCSIETSGPEFAFCEDATVWPGTGNVLVSCDAGRKEWNTVMGPLMNPEPHGSLWLVGAKDAPQRVHIHNYPPKHDFHPLGIAVSDVQPDNDASNLFVVNHARQRSYIEHFSISLASGVPIATHIQTLSSRAFIAPNALALTSPTSFYVSNDHLLTRRLPSPFAPLLPMLETLLGLPFGWVSHVSIGNTQKQTHSAPFIPFANGVSISPSGTTLAVAATSLSVVYIYTRDPTTNVLSAPRTVRVPFHPDNLEYDASGTLVVAGHAHFPSLIKVKADTHSSAGVKAPSWVVAINPESFEVTTLFQSNGSAFSTSSTALRLDNVLYLTGLYEDGVMLCRIPSS
ncbi:hypothetical protein MKEN_00350200 [Mycena kentingensis (nom. inval.)]|nr:hypothetical protein MKEN_00350200 [Mycena kentingensis (nom. inval.)]